MRYQGRLQDWNDDKGYGFVVPNGGGERAFVHIKAFARGAQRPGNGALVSYEARKDERGRLNAKSVRFVVAARRRSSSRSDSRSNRAATIGSNRRMPRVWTGLAAFGGFLASWQTAQIPAWVMLTTAALSLLALLFYLQDKRAARRGQWRTPESTLHLIALFGGWPGALVAQGLFQHKTSKPGFQVVFWATVALNVIALVALVKLKAGIPG